MSEGVVLSGRDAGAGERVAGRRGKADGRREKGEGRREKLGGATLAVARATEESRYRRFLNRSALRFLAALGMTPH